MDLFCVSPFPDGREKFQSRWRELAFHLPVPQSGGKAKTNHVYHVNPVKCLLFTPELDRSLNQGAVCNQYLSIGKGIDKVLIVREKNNPMPVFKGIF